MAAARRTVESEFAVCWIGGEITNFTRAASGHWYFVLRDSEAQADCIMLRRYNALLPAPPAEGDAVEVLAQASIYPPRGRFQLLARFLRHTGDGHWHQLYARRKREWAARGWFAAAAKQTPPSWPRAIGIIGSTSGAAVRDVLRTLKMRMPSIAVVVYPAPAQGEDAAAKIAAAIRIANRRNECETLLVVRGGGGIEDLWAFNEEETIAAIVESRLPIIAGIGHEIDETLADLAADLRAPTPTGAAVLASPDGRELRAALAAAVVNFRRAAVREFRDRTQRLDWASAALSRPSAHLHRKEAELQNFAARFGGAAAGAYSAKQTHLYAAAARLRPPRFAAQTAAMRSAALFFAAAAKRKMESADFRLQRAAAVLRACDPQNTLARGYGIIRDAAGKIVLDGDALRGDDELNLTFAKGAARAKVLGEK